MIELFKSGGPVMYPLLACSIIALGVIIERSIFWLRVDIKRNQGLVEEVLELCLAGDWKAAVGQQTAGSQNSIIKILISGIMHRDYSMTKAMEAAAVDEIKRMRRYMGVLDTMITVAPLLGIFGTVIGIIVSFDMLGTAGIEDPRAVTSGIAQALITTAAGLGIAILSVFPYNYFNGKVETAAQMMEQYSTRLEIIQERHAGASLQGVEDHR